MADFKFEIIEHIGILSTSKSGWNRELNLISWNGMDPKHDLRDWDPEHEKMGKGISLTEEELSVLKGLVNQLDVEETVVDCGVTKVENI